MQIQITLTAEEQRIVEISGTDLESYLNKKALKIMKAATDNAKLFLTKESSVTELENNLEGK